MRRWFSRWRARSLFINASWLLLFVAVYLGVRAWQQHTLAEGPAPVLRAALLDGQTFDLAASRGEPLLVYFWASWCPVCRLEQGAISALARDHRVVTIAMQSGSNAAVARYLQEQGMVLPVINDPDGAIASAWGVRATPSFFIVDTRGVIRFREVGYTSEPGLRLRMWLAR
jgi:peroxiredoxin